VSDTALIAKLTKLLERDNPAWGPVRIAEVTPVFGGNARLAWAFDAHTASGGEHACILLAQVAGKHVESDTAEEYAVLRAMNGHGVCAPAALGLDTTGEVAGGPALVLARMSGEASAVDFLKLAPEVGFAATSELARETAKLHAFDWQGAGLKAAPNPVLHEIEQWESRFLSHRLEPLPALAALFRWLKANVPVPARLSLIHGDLRPGNFLFEGAKITGLLDWEMAHIGDPAEDIAWIYRALWSPEKFLSFDGFAAQHAQLSGIATPRRNLTYYRIFSEVKFATISVSAAASYAAGATENLRHIDRAAKIPEAVRLCHQWIDSEKWEGADAAA